jgi:hypothetical protein
MAGELYLGVAVTPFTGGTAPGPVTPSNPLPVSAAVASLFAVVRPAAGFAAGDNELVAAHATAKICVLSFRLDLGEDVRTVYFTSGPGGPGTRLTTDYTDANQVNEQALAGMFETAAAEALNLNVDIATAAIASGGKAAIHLTYQLIEP